MVSKSILQIAIDGPVAAGKSTVAKQLADELKLLYIDTGAMYRATALAANKQKVCWNDEAGLADMLDTLSIVLQKPNDEKIDGRKVTVLLNGKDVSWEIRTQEMGEGASVVSQFAKVRSVLVKKQQGLAKNNRVVMEGRDIGTRVLVDAAIKIFMTADVNQRVKWKQKDLEKIGQKLSIQEVRSGLVARDSREKKRKLDPLRPAKDAWILDTTELNIDEVVKLVVQRVQDMGF